MPALFPLSKPKRTAVFSGITPKTITKNPITKRTNTSKLQQRFNWSHMDTTNLHNYAVESANKFIASRILPCPKIIAYLNKQAKNEYSKNAQEANSRDCITVKAALPHYLARRPAIGVVLSPFSTNNQERNEWHAVAVLRKGTAVWVFDPEFDNNKGEKTITKLSEKDGLTNAGALIEVMGKIERIQMRGVADTSLACMGLCAQWMDKVLWNDKQANGSLSDFHELKPTKSWTTVLL